METLVVKITYLNDSMDCETCGGGWASGWSVECEQRPELEVSLVPFAHCYDSTDFADVEHLYRAWIANGVKIPGVRYTEQLLEEYDFMSYLMPDMYKVVRESYTDAEGELVTYDYETAIVGEMGLVQEYLTRVYGVPVEIVCNTINTGDDDYEYDE